MPFTTRPFGRPAFLRSPEPTPLNTSPREWAHIVATRPALAATFPQDATQAEKLREWAAHIEAGRIGVPAPRAEGGGDFGCASLAAILGISHPGDE